MGGSGRPVEQSKFVLSLRIAFVMVLALLTGAGAGFLLWGASVPVTQAVLGGFAVCAAAMKFYDTIIE